MTSLLWFRDDLRIADHPALVSAVERGEPVVCLYVLDEESDGIRPLGGATRWWLHHSLVSLAERLEQIGGRLVLRRGPAAQVVSDVVREVGARYVAWNRRYGGPEREIDAHIKQQLTDAGVEARSFAANLLFEPWEIRTGAGHHFKVFTPFWKACLAAPTPRAPLPVPDEVVSADVASDDLDDWRLLPTRPDWSGGLARTWQPGEPAALDLLDDFLDGPVDSYADDRERPAVAATSRLSPHLRFGEISPHTVRHAAHGRGGDVDTFLKELGWREFAWHTLYFNPDLATVNLDRRFDAFPWPDLDHDLLRAWQRGETGVGLVDAGMRELWETGTMHNRVRMVAASFLVKNLLVDWRLGEQWFWDTLVDADAASNPFNWQWVAGCGADAAPYFRVFNPELQAKKFDPDGTYRARWGVRPDAEPLVDLKESRAEALAAYQHVKQA